MRTHAAEKGRSAREDAANSPVQEVRPWHSEEHMRNTLRVDALSSTGREVDQARGCAGGDTVRTLGKIQICPP